jgi:hypothetical protein
MARDRQQLIRRFVAVSHELADMAEHKLLPNLVSDREGELLEELDQIEYELGWCQRLEFI